MSVKRDVARLKQDADELLIARLYHGDKAAAAQIWRRYLDAFFADIDRAMPEYTAQVERITASAADDIRQAWRGAWQLAVDMRAAECAGDMTRATVIGQQIGAAFHMLPEFNGVSLIGQLCEFYDTARPGFKIAPADMALIGDLLRDE